MYNYITVFWVLLGTFDDSQGFIIINSFEWVFPSEKIVYHDTDTPHVAFLIVDIVLFRDFGCAIGSCPYKAPDSICVNFCSCPKVYQLNLLVFADKNILRLKVSMAYAMCVALFDCFQRLLDYVGHIPFSHWSSLPQPIESVHPFKELCDQIKVLSVLKHLENFNDIRVSQPFQRICFIDKFIKFIFREANLLYSLDCSYLCRVGQFMAL